ncbi:hypothetical protein [Stratiformator vulcanicus]|uniref:Uncharacterized protein n=1 Tax=Stratiformator vulcanicus TaxID=2527980 RepID=A0A517R2Y0_9PLAN|nr:hypothetical protein [Stratiformator vulcanicus]QDT38235.1 hypothetical protein Pan189_26250 [Stratiformator vulcanicus]
MPPVLQLGPFKLTPTALGVSGSPELEQWGTPLKFALWCQQASPWWIGDLLNQGDARFGEMFSQVCEGAVSADQLQRYESVARRVPAENRVEGLSWSAHAAVARLPHKMQREMLARAERLGWTSALLQKKVRQEIARQKAKGIRVVPDEPRSRGEVQFAEIDSGEGDDGQLPDSKEARSSNNDQIELDEAVSNTGVAQPASAEKADADSSQLDSEKTE